MNKINLSFLLLLFTAFHCSCRQQSTRPSGEMTMVFLDSAQASVKIIAEDNDRFFANIQALDVSIQMKQAALKNDPQYLEKYKSHLQTQVSTYSAEDQVFLQEVFEAVKTNLKKINPYFTLSIEVAKIKPGHYGDDVFYTRGNVIYFPENIFKEKNAAKITSIMLHEIWHILSEKMPEFRSEMYGLIGFEKHGKKMVFPPKLKSNLLTNPDGGSTDYGIKTQNGKWIIPVIRSNKPAYTSSESSFFNYLQFDLYGLDEEGRVITGVDGLSSSLSVEDNALYFQKIKDNTQYIIHPDEIIADNFMLAVQASAKDEFKNFSPQGQSLLKAILEKMATIKM